MRPRARVGLIWDIDGTLCDSFELGFSATNSVLVANGFDAIEAAAYHAGCVWTTPVRLARHCGLVPGDADFETRGAALGATFDATYIALVNPETAGFYAGVHALLDRAARCRSGDESSVALGALTNAARDYATAVLATNEATELFGSVHGADSVPGAKPLPDGLLVVAGELGLAPERCIYVGDSPSDGGAARAANFGASIGVSYGSHAIEKLASSGNFDVIVHSVAELEELLFGPVQADAAADYAQLCAATIDRPKVLA